MQKSYKINRFVISRGGAGVKPSRLRLSRNARCVLPGIPYHVTQRGTDRQKVYRAGGAPTWKEMFAATPVEEQIEQLRHCAYGGRPFGSDEFVETVEEHFKRSWRRMEKLAKTA